MAKEKILETQEEVEIYQETEIREKGKQIHLYSIWAYEEKFDCINYTLHLKKSALINKGLVLKKDMKLEELSEMKSFNNLISLFESALTRELNIAPDESTTDIFIFKFKITNYLLNEKLIKEGFYFENCKYIFYSASAGQTRNKKGTFIKESIYKEHEKNLMCGLTEDKINELGGMNPNKFLAYKALSMSKSNEWDLHDFNINKTILVDDYETEVKGHVDYIETDEKMDNYFIPVRKEEVIKINHTDGMGLISNKITNKAVQVRLPWIKGLLVPVNFEVFAKETGKNSINGISINEIDIIFTKSQYKVSDE